QGVKRIAYGPAEDQEAAAARGDFGNRGVHGLGTAVVALLADARHCVGADNERAAGKECRLSYERRCDAEPYGVTRVELPQAGLHFEKIKWRLVDVLDRDFESHRTAQDSSGDVGHPAMADMQRMERPAKNGAGKFVERGATARDQ